MSERPAMYRVLRPLLFIVDGNWRTTVQLAPGDHVERVLLADLPIWEALPFNAMVAKDAKTGRQSPDDVVFFRVGGQVRSAVHGRDVTVPR